jgi:hypothetical protein
MRSRLVLAVARWSCHRDEVPLANLRSPGK